MVNTVKTGSVLWLLLGVTLPLKDQISTIAILLLLIFSIWLFIKNKEESIKGYWFLLWIPFLIFFPRIIGLITGDFQAALREGIRAVPLLLLPLIALIFSTKKKTINVEKSFFYGLLIGLSIAFVFLEFMTVRALIANEESLEFLFRWRHMNFNFTKPLNAHPAYLGILIIMLVALSLFRSYVTAVYKLLIVSFSFIFLFQLLARNALVIYAILISYYVLKSKKGYLKFLVFGVFVTLSSIIFLHPSDYLRKKFTYFLQEDAVILKDNRFSRLQASFEVFKQAPFFGVGPLKDDLLRKIEYEKIEDKLAFEETYNSHNQFVEYLSTYGLFGIICFGLSLAMLLALSFQSKSQLYLFLLAAFIFASFTESVLERSLGIKYFSILIALILYKTIKNSNESYLSNGCRS